MEQMKKYADAEDERLRQSEGKRPRQTSKAYKVIYSYIQEILFKFIFTVSGFVALLVANYIFSSLKSISDIGVGTAIILVFLIIWGISGVSGYLTFLIVYGKFPITGR
jgi:membrane-bound ClpP family serine protease